MDTLVVFFWKNNEMRLYLQIFFITLMLLLSACADTEWPQWISGEPTKEQLDAYKGPIPMPDPNTEGKAWPNLADVPARPKIILKDKQKDALVTEMKEKNAHGLKEIEDYNKNAKPAVKPIVKSAPKKPLHQAAHKTVTKKKHKKKATPDVK